MKLKGAVAIVTGSARGIGRGIAVCLAREGVHVVIADLGQNQDIAREMEETARQVRAHGVEALTVNTDVRDWAQVQGMVKAATDRLGTSTSWSTTPESPPWRPWPPWRSQSGTACWA